MNIFSYFKKLGEKASLTIGEKCNKEPLQELLNDCRTLEKKIEPLAPGDSDYRQGVQELVKMAVEEGNEEFLKNLLTDSHKVTQKTKVFSIMAENSYEIAQRLVDNHLTLTHYPFIMATLAHELFLSEKNELFSLFTHMENLNWNYNIVPDDLFFFACKTPQCNIQIYKYLLSKVASLSNMDSRNFIALHYLIEENNEEKIEAYLKNSCVEDSDLQYPNRDYENSLTLMDDKKTSLYLCDLLLAAMEKYSVKRFGRMNFNRTSLSVLSGQKREEMFDLFFQHGYVVSPNTFVEKLKSGFMPFCRAAIRAGVSVECVNEQGVGIKDFLQQNFGMYQPYYEELKALENKLDLVAMLNHDLGSAKDKPAAKKKKI